LSSPRAGLIYGRTRIVPLGVLISWWSSSHDEMIRVVRVTVVVVTMLTLWSCSVCGECGEGECPFADCSLSAGCSNCDTSSGWRWISSVEECSTNGGGDGDAVLL
jgi:hypothetical protein